MKKNKILVFIFIVVLLVVVFNVNMFAATRIHIPINQLQDSEIYGGYSERYTAYNCYAFAIDRFEEFNLTDSTIQIPKYEPGYFSSGTSQFHPGITDEEGLAIIVSQDLSALGMNILYCGENMPSVEDNEKLICMRVSSNDYHFMKYVKEENIWLHKPGDSCILKYNKTVCNENIWLNEYAYMSNYNIDEGTYEVEYYHGEEGTNYNSDIFYILYETPEKIILDCKSKNVIVNDILVGTREIVHEVEIKCNVFYIFTLITDFGLDYVITNENMESITYKQVGDSIENGYEFSYRFGPGKYFIFLYSKTNTIEFDVELDISAEVIKEPLNEGQNDIVNGHLYFTEYLHEINENKYEGLFTFFNTVEGFQYSILKTIKLYKTPFL